MMPVELLTDAELLQTVAGVLADVDVSIPVDALRAVADRAVAAYIAVEYQTTAQALVEAIERLTTVIQRL